MLYGASGFHDVSRSWCWKGSVKDILRRGYDAVCGEAESCAYRRAQTDKAERVAVKPVRVGRMVARGGPQEDARWTRQRMGSGSCVGGPPASGAHSVRWPFPELVTVHARPA